MTIEECTLALMHHLEAAGLVGPSAIKYGGPDEVVLLSGGPASHLSTHSMFCGPSSRRFIVRQPSIEPAPPHKPSKGETLLAQQSVQLVGRIEEWKHGCWYHATSIFDETLAGLLGKLKGFSNSKTFTELPANELPQRPFWAGSLAYDLVQWTQPLALQHPPKEGDILCVLWLVERFVVETRATGQTEAFAMEGDDWAERVNALKDTAPKWHPPSHDSNPHPESSSMSDAEHEQGIETIRKSIAAGQLYQVNLGRWWEGQLNEHPRTIFERLCHTNPAPFSAYLHSDDLGLALVSSSPELLLQSDGKRLKTSPIKGTRPRGATADQEKELRFEMLNDEKERAEHRMLVDLMRNDLGSVCAVGSVEVERFDVEAYATVQHLVSRVTGELSEGVTSLDALQAVFPGGSITGCPRTVVCATIDELEARPRSFWTGSIGWFDAHSGASAWNILIRTLIAQKTKKQWHGAIAAGGGITIGSSPANEVEEAKWKAAALRTACGWDAQKIGDLPKGRLEIHALEPEPVPTPVEIGRIYRDVAGLELKQCVLLIDNLDSFTQNIAHAVAGLGHTVVIHQSRSAIEHTATEAEVLASLVQRLNPTHVLLGPGPGEPSDSPLTLEIAHQAVSGLLNLPILGICLGHQALGVAAGMELIQVPTGPVHGSPRAIKHEQTHVFEGLDSPHPFALYNSLVLVNAGVSAWIETAHLETTGDIMGIRHQEDMLFGIQFHPESVGSPNGIKVLRNFLKMRADA
ncbi:MAG: chorismate-binding protein [Euryarchaeota archaeon]